MSVSDEDIAFAKELFEGVGHITTRKMMGGLCLYSDGTIFALLYSDGTLFIKAQGDFIDEVKALGCTQWTYQREGKDKPTAMPYWTLPEACLDDPDEAKALARKALSYL
ncbi:TfoX/Sxy family protein [uncultured Litoreibacter sp.]|uniref:TfoX/Sxy family protein n=1 Tax=uncultured Litoreibacter sp. TaxID=1392394 RepID=UPI002639213B|nr:TfoX/Sxy family protein [uncultured Litoreibacter sp.]